MKTAGAAATGLAVGSSSFTGSAAADHPHVQTPWLEVDGNLVKTEDGDTVKFRGLNIADPKRQNTLAGTRGKTALQTLELITSQEEGWYPRLIRIPVQPIDIGEHQPGTFAGPPDAGAFTEDELNDYIENHLDPVVDFLEQKGVYCIVDYHRHWGEGDFEWDQPELADEVDMFWEIMSQEYGDRSHVLFEIYNEPTEPGLYGPSDNPDEIELWNEWVSTAQPWIDTIRSNAPDNLILIGSPSWTQSPEFAAVDEADDFTGGNLAYTYHIYPGAEAGGQYQYDQHVASLENDWDMESSWDNGASGTEGVHEEVPLFVTEFGWEYPHEEEPLLEGTVDGFGDPFMDWLESNDGVHWTAWNADPDWLPTMFDRGDWAPEDGEDIEDPYNADIPDHCEDLPCEWVLLGEDKGDYGDKMGAYIKETLEEVKDDRVPPEAEDNTGGECEDVDSETLDNGQMVCDIDGDGNYRDVNADGSVSNGDITDFFSNQHVDPWDSRTDLFDFDGDNDVGQGDVVALFNYVN